MVKFILLDRGDAEPPPQTTGEQSADFAGEVFDLVDIPMP